MKSVTINPRHWPRLCTLRRVVAPKGVLARSGERPMRAARLTVATLLGVCVVSVVRRQASLARYGRVAPDEDEPVVSVRRVPSRVR